MTRKEARDFMMKVIFQMEASKDFDVNNKRAYFNNIDIDGQKEYCDNIYSLMCNKKDDIDEYIKKHSSWVLERIPKTDLASLRIGIIELAFLEGIPYQVAINEAVDISKKYGSEDSPKYVNGILSNVLADIKED